MKLKDILEEGLMASIKDKLPKCKEFLRLYKACVNGDGAQMIPPDPKRAEEVRQEAIKFGCSDPKTAK